MDKKTRREIRTQRFQFFLEAADVLLDARCFEGAAIMLTAAEKESDGFDD